MYKNTNITYICKSIVLTPFLTMKTTPPPPKKKKKKKKKNKQSQRSNRQVVSKIEERFVEYTLTYIVFKYITVLGMA